MNTSALKAQINIDTITTRALRAEATRLRNQARTLEKRADASEKAGDSKKTERQVKAAQSLRLASFKLRHRAAADSNTRRHQHLAAALLNGKTYGSCEPRIDRTRTVKADPEYIAIIIKDYLPEEEKPHAQHIAEQWLGYPTLTLRGIQRGDLDRHIAIDRIDKRIRDLEKSAKQRRRTLSSCERNVRTAQKRLRDAERSVSNTEKALDELLEQIAGLRRDREALANPEPAKPPTNEVTCIDDLFEDAA